MKNIYSKHIYGAAVVALLVGGLVSHHAFAQTVFLTSELQVGSRGPEVTALQQFLATNALVYPQGLVTGYYGELTKAAVQQFQIAHNLPTVGRVGPLTLAKLNMVHNFNWGLDVSAPVMGQVLVSNSGNTSTLSWTTNESTQAKVFYDTKALTRSETSGTGSNEPIVSGRNGSDTNWSNSHTVVLDTSSQNTTYYYLVESMDQSGNVSVAQGTFSR